MLKITRKSDDRLDIEMSGRLDSQSMTAALDELIEKSRGIEHGKMLYDVIDYRLPTLPAIAIEFSRMPAMMGFIGQFDRAAVLADRAWLKAVSELEGKLMPGLEIRAFGRDQRAEAEDWLEGRSPGKDSRGEPAAL